MTRSISEYSVITYHSAIVGAVVLGQAETLGENGTLVRTVGKAWPGRSPRYRAGRPEPQVLCGTLISSRGRGHNTGPCVSSVFRGILPSQS